MTDVSTVADPLVFVVISLLFGIICRVYLKSIFIPYPVLLLLVGMILCAIGQGSSYDINYFRFVRQYLDIWTQMNPRLILFIFIPPLVFDGAISADYHIIQKSMIQVYLLLLF